MVVADARAMLMAWLPIPPPAAGALHPQPQGAAEPGGGVVRQG